MEQDVNYAEWERSVPQAIKGDTLWKLKVYRMGLYIADISWPDVTILSQDR